MGATSRRDLGILLMMAALSVVLIYGGQNLQLGSTARMGAGYVPRMLAIGCAVLAVVFAGRLMAGLLWSPRKAAEAADVGPVHWRALVSISVSVVAFALLIRPAGLITASLVAVLVCSVAQTYRGWGERLILAGGLAAFSGLLFVTALGLPFDLFPTLR